MISDCKILDLEMLTVLQTYFTVISLKYSCYNIIAIIMFIFDGLRVDSLHNFHFSKLVRYDSVAVALCSVYLLI